MPNQASESLAVETQKMIDEHVQKYKTQSEKALEEALKQYDDRMKQHEKHPDKAEEADLAVEDNDNAAPS